MRLAASLVLAVAAGAACSAASSPAADRFELAVRSPGGSAAWITLVAVSAKDDRVRIFPGTRLEHQNFMAGHREYELHLRDARIVDGTGREVSACRDGAMIADHREAARLTADGFVDAARTTTLHVAGDGHATLVRANETQELRFTAGTDPCTAALLYFLIPAPRAG